MFLPSPGEDHLGLGSVSSDQILPRLSPTINVATVHPRYHSFHAFLVDEFWRRDLPRSRHAWIGFFRPRDFIYSVACQLCDHPRHDVQRGITGSQKTRGLVRRDPPAYDTTFNYIGEPDGGYGLYYRSVAEGLGFVYPGGSGRPYPVDVLTERGKELAARFREAVAATRYYREWFDEDEALVPGDVVREYGREACLCRLRDVAAPDGPALRDAFLHEPAEHAEARRLTLRFLLELAHQTVGIPIGQDEFRRLAYFRSLGDATFEPRAEIERTADEWRLYQAREYHAFVLTGIFGHLVDWGLAEAGDLRPVPLARVREHVEAAAEIDALAERLGVAKPGIRAASPFADLVAWLPTVCGDPAVFDEEAALHEHRLYELAYEDGPVERVAGGLVMFAVLYVRFGPPERRVGPAWANVSTAGSDGRVPVDRFIRDLRSRLRRGTPRIGEIAWEIVRRHVLQQHQMVAARKLPENTFRFERDGGRLRFHDLSRPLAFSDSRFEALSTTVHELGLCGRFEDPDHGLTELGERLLNDGDLAT